MQQKKQYCDKALRVLPPTTTIHCPATISLSLISPLCCEFPFFGSLMSSFSHLHTSSLSPSFQVFLFLSGMMAARLPVDCAGKYSFQSHTHTVIHAHAHTHSLTHKLPPSKCGFCDFQCTDILFDDAMNHHLLDGFVKADVVPNI